MFLTPSRPEFWSTSVSDIVHRYAMPSGMGRVMELLSHTSLSTMVPFSRSWATTSSSLEVPNSASSWPLAAPSMTPWLPCL